MKRILTFFILITLYLMQFRAVYASTVESGASASMQMKNISQTLEQDIRIIHLNSYLKKHSSPIANYAGYMIKKADEYELPDWRLVPAISGVESTFGKAIPTNSYNAWGWANGAYYFTSWEDAISIVTQTLKTNYIDRGLDTVEKIAPVYAPPSNTWAGKVNYFMKQISTSYLNSAEQLDLTI